MPDIRNSKLRIHIKLHHFLALNEMPETAFITLRRGSDILKALCITD